MRLNIKISIAAIAWTVALATAFGRALSDTPGLTVWSILAAAVGSTATAALIVDYVAVNTARYIVHEVSSERDATVQKAVGAMHEDSEDVADRIVERLASKQDEVIEHVAHALVEAMAEKADRPTQMRPR